MQFIFSVFTSYPYLDFPYDLAGWFGFLIFTSALVLGWIKIEVPKTGTPRRWMTFSLLFIFAMLASLFIGFRFPAQNQLQLFDFYVIYHPAAVMIFSAIPVVLAAGFLGPHFAAMIGASCGLLIGLWDTHNIFTVVEYSGLGFLFALAIRQHYSSFIFPRLRHPLVAAVLIPIVFIPFTMASSFFSAGGELAIRLDYALTQSWPIIIARAIEYLAAGFIGEIFYLSKMKSWAPIHTAIRTPWESRLSRKFMFTIFPIFLIAFLVLLIGDWITAGIASRKLMEDRLGNMTYIAAESLPYFLKTGQNLIDNYADDELLILDNTDLEARLAQWMDSIPFFSDLAVFDETGKLINQYPRTTMPFSSQEELAGIQLAMDGAQQQVLAVGVADKQNSARIAFIARVENPYGNLLGVLIGHTDLQTNPFTRPAIQAINALEESGGEGWILDEESRILYHTNPSEVMDRHYGFTTGTEQRFYQQTNPGEIPKYLYFQRAVGRPWAVVLSVPTAQVQQLALDIAIPLLIVLIFISVALIFSIQYLISRVTSNLHLLVKSTSLIANGHLEQSLSLQDNDEVGQLAEAFEQMRLRLKDKLEEINSLLLVSQGVASNLDVERAIHPILEACMQKNACSARAVIYEFNADLSHSKTFLSFGYGIQSEQYSYLDEQIFNLISLERNLVVNNCFRTDKLLFKKGFPGALIAFPLSNENMINGMLWIGFERPRRFSGSDLQFFSTLAGQASLAAINANLYRSAEIGRQRMEAILNSSPEPVLVFDHDLRLLLLNPAATQVPMLIKSDIYGTPVGEVISHKVLLDMICQPLDVGTVSREICMPDGRTYTVSVAEVIASGREVGKICLMRDISRYKELDTLKSEFVSTVSHDLKAPLTMMKGYTTMLDMVGELNTQQKNYTQKITEGIDQMAQLVSDILDLGRIESGVGLQVSHVNIIEVIEKVVSAVGPRAMQKDIQLIINESVDSGISIRTDISLLYQALVNLVENGVKYTSLGGQVEISTLFGDESVIFEIKDKGIGISPVDIPYIFDKFYRSGQKDVFQLKGTGLGLTIVKSIAERLGGKVWVKSQLGKGSTFFFEIPYQINEVEH